MRLVKDGKIILDGTLRECEKEKIAFEKLEKIENLEEESGVDLITLFEALKNGCYVKGYNDRQEICLKINSLNDVLLYLCPVNIFNEYVFAKDYGKTWSLDKEELLL